MLSYELTIQAYIEYQIDFSDKTKLIYKSVLQNRLMFIVFTVLTITLLILLMKNEIKYYFSLCIFISGIVNFVSAKKQFIKKIAKTTKKMIESGNADKILGKRNLSIENNILIYTSDNSSSKVEINKIETIRESSLYIFLYLDSFSAIIVPKNAFANIDEEKQFYNEIESKILTNKDKTT